MHTKVQFLIKSYPQVLNSSEVVVKCLDIIKYHIGYVKV